MGSLGGSSTGIVIAAVCGPTKGVGLPSALGGVMRSVVRGVGTVVRGHTKGCSCRITSICRSSIASRLRGSKMRPSSRKRRVVTSLIYGRCRGWGERSLY